MQKIKFFLLLILITFFISSCGSSGGAYNTHSNPSNSSEYPSPDNQEIPKNIGSSLDAYVSQYKGEENATGKKNSPFKTISQALEYFNDKNRTLSHTINISGGVYNIENGENFPLILDNGISLVRSDENNQSVEINGSGYYTDYEEYISIVLNGNNRLQSINISSTNNIAILSQFGKNTIQNSRLRNNKIGFLGIGNAQTTIANNLITKNSDRGILLLGNSSIYLKSNWIIDNEIGVELNENSKFSDISQNTTISANHKCDFYYKVNNDINLTGIVWDKNISDIIININECKDGNEITNISGIGEIFLEETKNSIPIDNNISNEINSSNSDINLTHGFNQEIAPTKSFFQETDKIQIEKPKYAEYFNSSEEIKFEYDANNKYLMIALWKNSPRIVKESKNVSNPEQIIWYWHTGIEQESDDSISYNEGRVPKNGELNPINHNNENKPTALKNGDYYLTIWAWDNKGLEVTHSSIISKFYIYR